MGKAGALEPEPEGLGSEGRRRSCPPPPPEPVDGNFSFSPKLNHSQSIYAHHLLYPSSSGKTLVLTRNLPTPPLPHPLPRGRHTRIPTRTPIPQFTHPIPTKAQIPPSPLPHPGDAKACVDIRGDDVVGAGAACEGHEDEEGEEEAELGYAEAFFEDDLFTHPMSNVIPPKPNRPTQIGGKRI